MASINTNISAYYAQNNLRAAGTMAQSSIAKLSSGNRIIQASDDVAALSIGTILRTNVSTLKTALVNASQGSTLLQIADGSLARVGEILQRQKALATQTNSGTLSSVEKGYLNQEFSKLSDELNRIVNTTNFNGVKLLDGSLAASVTSLATETPAALKAATTISTSVVDTSVLTGGAGSLALSAAGTGATINSLVGDLKGATALGYLDTDGTDDKVRVAVNVNGVNYRSAAIDTQGGAAAGVVFTATDGSGAAFTLDLADMSAGFTSGGATATEAQTYAGKVVTELQKLSVYHTSAIENTAATDMSAVTKAKFAPTVLAGMDGNDIKYTGKDFSSTDGKAPSVSNFVVTSTSSTSSTWSVTINGKTYSTANTPGLTGGAPGNADITAQDMNGTGAAGTGIVRMTSADDANSYIDIDLNTHTAGAISLVNQSDADALASALNGAFGSGSTGGVNFQVGIQSSDKISISLAGVTGNQLYVDNSGKSVNMDLVNGNIDDIQSALDNAIKTVTARRADVGALQSRFGYASAAIQVSVQNLDAARSQFLDADISEESTNFAKAQVLQQAAISVLAQANQIPQNLLKLIG